MDEESEVHVRYNEGGFNATYTITIMDLIAYGGAALGVIMAATQLKAGHVSVASALLIILLSADFFIPMRQLGSFFHIAMNGMAASDKIFRLLDIEENDSQAGMTNPTRILQIVSRT